MIRLRLSYRNLLILVSMLMVSIFVVSLGFQYYFSIEDYISEKLTAIEKSHLEQTAKNVDAQLKQIKSITEMIGKSEDIVDLAAQYDGGSYASKFKLKQNLESNLIKSANINRNVLAMAVFTRDSIVTQGNIPMYDLCQADLFPVYGENVVMSAQQSAIFHVPSSAAGGGAVSSDITKLKKSYSFSISLYKNGKNVGTLFLVLRDDLFSGMLGSSGNKFIFDDAMHLLYNGTKKENGTLSKMYADFRNDPETVLSLGGNRESYIFISSIGYGINIGFLLEKKDYLERVNNIRFFLILSVFVLLIISTFLSGLLSRIVVRPLKSLISRVKTYSIRKSALSERAGAEAARKSNVSMSESILIFLVVNVIVSTAVLAGTTYFLFSNIIDDFVKETTENTFNQTVENLDFYLNNAIYASENIIYSEEVQYAIQQKEIDSKTYGQVVARLAKGMTLFNGKTGVTIYNQYGLKLIDYMATPGMNPITSQFTGWKENYFFGETRKDIDGSYFIPFYMKVNNIKDFNNIGFYECRINELDIEKLYSSLEKDYSEVFIIDNKGTVISHSNKNMIGTHVDVAGLSNNIGNVKFMFQTELLKTGYTIVETYGDNTVEYDKTKFLLSEIYLLVIIFLITFLIAFLLSRNLPSAFKTLYNRINSINLDNLNVELGANSPINEINQLSVAFNDMSVRMKNLLEEVIVSTKKASELEKVKNQAEITSLQGQINPHFLYNTFENIYWMIRNDSKTEALFMIKCLSSMLRFIAKREPIIVDIKEEIAYTKTYAEIMKARYEEEIEFDFKIDPALEDYTTIKLVLQPIIENAIEHGIRPKAACGRISVEGVLLGDMVEFTIRDDGVGMDETTLRRLIEILDHQSDPDTIGLQNVQARIKLFYGEKYGLSVQSEHDSGTVITLCIPANRSEKDPL